MWYVKTTSVSGTVEHADSMKASASTQNMTISLSSGNSFVIGRKVYKGWVAVFWIYLWT